MVGKSPDQQDNSTLRATSSSLVPMAHSYHVTAFLAPVATTIVQGTHEASLR